jgi:hypothetical protein
MRRADGEGEDVMQHRFRGLVVATVMCATTLGAAGGATGVLTGVSLCGASTGASEQSSTAGAAFAGRGGDPREPDLGQTHQDLPASARGRAGPDFSARIPVYVHVVTDGTIGSLTTKQINDQIRVLNVTFAGGEGGTDTGFSFQLAGVTRTDNAAWFYSNPGGVNEHSMKKALRQGGPDALNLYSTTAGDYLGWAYLPEILTKPGQAYLDGVVIDWESMLGTSTTYAGRFDQGETATHEVGRWLNLSTPSSVAAAPRATSWPTPQRRRHRRPGARRARTRARPQGSIRFTTTWTIPSTPATRSSRPASRNG